MEIVTIFNRKGGVGKTATAHALGSGLTLKGYKVLYIDLDSQCNLTYTMGASLNPVISSYEVLTEEAGINEAIEHTENGDIIPASISLDTADLDITAEGKEFRLKNAIAELKGDYDFIIIDTPPSLNITTMNALTTSTRAIVPVEAMMYSIQALSHIYGIETAVQKYTNPNLKIEGILVTKWDKRHTSKREIEPDLLTSAQQLNTKVFKTYIRTTVKVPEAQGQQQDIYTYMKNCNASKDYMKFTEEFLESIGKDKNNG